MLLWVALGAAVGAPVRYLVDRWLNVGRTFPWGTFAVNVAGSFVLALLLGLARRRDRVADPRAGFLRRADDLLHVRLRSAARGTDQTARRRDLCARQPGRRTARGLCGPAAGASALAVRRRRPRDGLHPPAHQRLRDRRRRQRLPVAGREAEAVRQEGVRGRRPRLHERDSAAQLPRVHRLREPVGRAGNRRSRAAGRCRRPRRCRLPRRFRWCGAR